MASKRAPRRAAFAIASLLVSLAVPAARTQAATGWALDTTFGPDHSGIVAPTLTGNNDEGHAVAIYPPGSPNGDAGKIVMVGNTPDPVSGNNGRHDILVARYKPDGTLDDTFGGANKGYVVTADQQNHADRTANDVAIYPPGTANAGKIVVVGSSELFDPVFGSVGETFLVSRYNSNGTLDGSFGDAGTGQVAFLFPNPDAACGTSGHDPCNGSAVALGVTIQADGKIIAVGYTNFHSPEEDQVAVARLMPNGSLDSSFGGGRVATDSPSTGGVRANAVAIVPGSGRILVAGTFEETNGGLSNLYPFVFAYTSGGTVDGSFSNGGTLILHNADIQTGNGLVVYPASDQAHAGQFLLAGGSPDPNFTSSTNGFAAARFTTSGDLDQAFGSGGVAKEEFGRGSFGAKALLQSGGQVVVVGGIVDPSDGQVSFGVVRFTPAGQPDPSFGQNGDPTIITPVGSANSVTLDGALDSSGRIIAVGEAGASPHYVFALARYTGPGVSTLKATLGKPDTWQTHSQYTLEWSASGTQTDQVTFDLRRRGAKWNQSNFGPWAIVKTKTHTTKASTNPNPGYTLCYQVRVHDGDDVSDWSNEECTATPIDDRSLEKSPKSAWGNRPDAGNVGGTDSRCYQGTFVAANNKGAYLTVEAAFKQLAVVVGKVPGSGSIVIRVDGKTMQTISLNAPKTVCNVLIPVATYRSATKRRVQIAVTKPGRVGVYVDGLGASLT